MSSLFKSFKLKGLVLKNRIMLSPMCQYQAKNGQGIPEMWHFVHYISRAIGGTGLIMTEMTNVEPIGRITEHCLGLYSDDQEEAFKRMNEEIHKYGAKSGVQLAHAGRKSKLKFGNIVGPSSIPFSEDYAIPKELTYDEIQRIIEKFANSAKRAVRAGFDTLEIHGAHGYLLHQFISRASNQRKDKYGEPTTFAKEVIEAVKSEIPTDMPLILRISAIEYTDNAYSLSNMISYCSTFVQAGIDMFDVSTGGNSVNKPEVYPAYQAKYAKSIKDALKVPVISVGKLEDPWVSELIIRDKYADIVAIGKGMLKDPHWAKNAAETLKFQLEMPGVYGLGY